jgi:hypothetical protein
MLAAQRLRDAYLADALIGAAGRPAVLITGGGHARLDYGVPFYLGVRAPEARVVSIGLTEVVADATEPTAYARTEGTVPAFDFLWFTPRTDTEDPCELFREQLERMRQPGPAD